MNWLLKSASHHPYYPKGVSIINYVPNSKSTLELLSTIGISFSIVIGSCWYILGRYRGLLSRSERWAATWFIFCGLLHIIFEGSFVLNFRTLAGSQDIFSQLWKEYALCDSRYLTGDIQVLVLEAISVIIWGPLSLLSAKSIIDHNPSRYILQTIVCIGHLYGVAIYYLTSLAEFYANGRLYSRPEFLYFWVYFVGFNMPWAVVPAIIIRSCLHNGKTRAGTR